MSAIKNYFFLAVLTLAFSGALAQKPGTAKSKPQQKPAPVVLIKGCRPEPDSAKLNKLSLKALNDWTAATPLVVVCSNGIKYDLTYYNFTLIVKSPMEIKDFGVGGETIPYLAKKAMETLKPGDTIILKDVKGTGPDKKETALANVVFSITD